MREFARLDTEERRRVFQVISAEMGISPAMIEKDFWVCFTLDNLFHDFSYKERIVFKGGTSLSKAYGLISRFSEDIDLILDWRLLGFGLDEPWQERSNTKQDQFNKKTTVITDAFLKERFVPALKESLSKSLGIDADVRMADEEQTVVFAYPRMFESNATLDIIRLEIGPLAAWTPTEVATVTSYVAETRPSIFSHPKTDLATVMPERTFWEKATILHQEANRPEPKSMPRRYSRHYYDMHKLGHSWVKNRAFNDLGLLEKVVGFKKKFYRVPWSQLRDAKPGTFRLAPPEYRIPELARDYESMQEMLFGERPSFEDVIDYMRILEHEINSIDSLRR